MSPFDHEKLKGATPPETVKSTAPVESLRHKISVPAMDVNIGMARLTMVTDSVAEQPFASSTSTVYAPAGAGFTSSLKVRLLHK